MPPHDDARILRLVVGDKTPQGFLLCVRAGVLRVALLVDTADVANPDVAGIRAADVVIDEITQLALSLGGTISGEHGIGSVKRHELPWQLDAVTLDVQRAIKHALDPNGILTPDRAI